MGRCRYTQETVKCDVLIRAVGSESPSITECLILGV